MFDVIIVAMKEGMVHLPADIVILEELGSGQDKSLRKLSLAQIADSQAEIIRESVRFIQEQQAQGNNDAAGFHSFHRDDRRDGKFIRYRVAVRGSWNTIHP